MKKSYHAPFIFGQPSTLQSQAPGNQPYVAIDSIPPAIDPARFARDESRLSGILSVARLPRLADVLFDQQGMVNYEVQGYTTANGQPALHLRVGGELALRCQRCLERLPLRIDATRDLVLIAETREVEGADNEDDDTDRIPRVASLDVLDLIEQEVVLSLPMAPRHSEDTCEAQLALQTGDASSPFSALAGLKRH
jgi:DUF177 domain-containing protein